MGMYVAFLKGMNVGRRRVKNEQLCACFEQMAFEDVSAFLASGNVLFRSAGKRAATLEAHIAKELERRLGYPVDTFVRSQKEVAAIARHQPFSETVMAASKGKLQIAMLSKAPAASERKAALALSTPDDQLAIEGRQLYWLPKGNMSESVLDLKALSKTLGLMTIRTHRTLTRLAAKLS